jgi:hypothetical protein
MQRTPGEWKPLSRDLEAMEEKFHEQDESWERVRIVM